MRGGYYEQVMLQERTQPPLNGGVTITREVAKNITHQMQMSEPSFKTSLKWDGFGLIVLRSPLLSQNQGFDLRLRR